MYTPMLRRAGLGAVTNVDDFGAVVSALGLHWQPSDVGFATWGDALKWVEGGNGTSRLASGGYGYVTPSGVPVPGFVALVQAWVSFHQSVNGYTPTAAQVVARLGVTGTVLSPGPRPASIPVTDYDWHEFAAAVLQYAPMLEQLFDAYAPGQVAPTPAQQVTLNAQQQWNAALAAGAFVVPGGAAAGFKVPKSLIVEGPTELPDGTIYLAYHDPRPGASGQFDPAVLWWNGPNYRPVTTSGPLVELPNHDLVQLKDRGTGDWYRCMVVYGGDDQTCRPPLSYTGPFTLPPEIARTLQPGTPNVIAPKVATAPAAGPTPAPAALYAPAQPTPTLTNPTPAPVLYATPAPAAGPATPTQPAPMYQSPTVVAASMGPQPTPVTTSLYQSPGVVGGDQAPAAAPAAPGMTTQDWLLAGLLVVGVGGLLLGDRKRARRR